MSIGIASETDMCNAALVKIGGNTISTLSDNTKEAKLCNIRYAYLRDEVLTAHPWNFAKVRTSLALGSTPAWYFTYSFPLPSDMMKLLGNDMDEGTEWALEKGAILTFVNTLNILYTQRVTDTTQFDNLFANSLSWRIAAELSYSLIQSAQLTKVCMDEYRSSLAEARSKNAQERGSPLQVIADDWSQARVVSSANNFLGQGPDPSKL